MPETGGFPLDESCRQRLIALARRKLGPDVRRQLDPEDIVQSVFKSFFLRPEEAQGYSAEDLQKLLAYRTARKCDKKLRNLFAQRRDVRREEHPGDSDSWQPADPRELSPEEEAALHDLRAWLRRQLAEEDFQVIELKAQGFNTAEISEQVGCCDRTVRRVLERGAKLLTGILELPNTP
ncbi:MAG: sigma-70 family RNA polymerase sigma factor [Gemmataceae bacterium]|nr:sigma-70 family RNA polymerase sigma factor [Gemmataceae bacterium]